MFDSQKIRERKKKLEKIIFLFWFYYEKLKKIKYN